MNARIGTATLSVSPTPVPGIVPDVFFRADADPSNDLSQWPTAIFTVQLVGEGATDSDAKTDSRGLMEASGTLHVDYQFTAVIPAALAAGTFEFSASADDDAGHPLTYILEASRAGTYAEVDALVRYSVKVADTRLIGESVGLKKKLNGPVENAETLSDPGKRVGGSRTLTMANGSQTTISTRLRVSKKSSTSGKATLSVVAPELDGGAVDPDMVNGYLEGHFDFNVTIGWGG